MENKLTKKGVARVSNSGRKQIFIDDVGVTLSVQVPSKEKENFKNALLEMRRPFETKIYKSICYHCGSCKIGLITVEEILDKNKRETVIKKCTNCNIVYNDVSTLTKLPF